MRRKCYNRLPCRGSGDDVLICGRGLWFEGHFLESASDVGCFCGHAHSFPFRGGDGSGDCFFREPSLDHNRSLVRDGSDGCFALKTRQSCLAFLKILVSSSPSDHQTPLDAFETDVDGALASFRYPRPRRG